MSDSPRLAACIARIAQLQNQSIDRISLTETADLALKENSPENQISYLCKQLTLSSHKWLSNVDQSQLPVLYYTAGIWGVVRGKNAKNEWVLETYDTEANQWVESTDPNLNDYRLVHINTTKKFLLSDSHVFQMVKEEIFSQKKILTEIIIASIVINTVALASSFYTMQVYDRVVPTGSSQTLLVLTLGVFIAIIYELLTKKIRGNLTLKLVNAVDKKLATNVYNRFLSIRLDQLPKNVGTTAGQIKG
ncbi:MAG: hypothetical protein OXE99_02320 [Cellvibrionales bacterium]|nr:hypothetical protein [Cellvibrionales bacterium]